MKKRFSCCASAAFGLEGLVADELRSLGMENVAAENGGVLFSADLKGIFLCNLSLRFCDRVFIMLAEDECRSFESLFQLVSSVPWEDYTSGEEAFNVSAKCARSQLMSPRDCQSITKKAILERLKSRTNRRVFPESGPAFPVLVSVHSDRVRILLNTSGEALSRRGYRTWNGSAPLRETLAAALVRLSPWNPGMALYDPCCGTGTILIEAAWMAANRLPGLTRSFAMEQFSFCASLEMKEIRNEAASKVSFARYIPVGGSDIDPDAIDLASRHVRQADVADYIHLSVRPLQDLRKDDMIPTDETAPESAGVVICNPPYGERLEDQKSCRALYRDLRLLKDRLPGWHFCVITSDPGFEKAFGLRANKKRRLYNGRLECVYYIYFGSRPVSA